MKENRRNSTPDQTMNRARQLVTAAMAALSAACTVRRAPAGLAEPPCYANSVNGEQGPSVEWVLRDESEERSALDAFCWGVGPTLFSVGAVDLAPVVADSFAVIAWNTHIGHGQLARLIRDVRSGELTGAPIQHFILLLQEVNRGGEAVPSDVPAWVAAGRRSSNPLEPGRLDVSEIAEQHQLSLFYAPSMRSGNGDGLPGEDRGNAILSTFPLQSPGAIELPWERQRRVAVSADIRGQTSNGDAWSLRLVSAHLDNRTRLAQIHRSFGATRERQSRALAEHLADSIPTVIGADLNSWLGGQRAAEVRVLREQFPLPASLPTTPTAKMPGLLPDRQLDYLLFRLPQGWEAEYSVLEDDYGSDHQPLLGWVRIAR
jgi:hypothetical protein